MKRIFTMIIMLVMVCLLAGCAKTPQLSFEKNTYDIEIGQEEVLSPIILYIEGEQLVKYTSSDESIAIVEGATLKGLSAGTAIIKASLTFNEEIFVELTVNVAYKEVENVVINGANKVAIDETIQLTATLLPEHSNGTVVWESSDKNVLTVSETGVVKGVAEGSAKVTAKVNNLTSEFNITVVRPATTGITITGNNTMSIGENQQLTIEINPANAIKDVAWISGDESIIEVTGEGVVTAVGKGEAEISVLATDGSNVISKFKITVVLPEAESVEVVLENNALSVAQTAKASAIVLPELAIQSVTWASSDESIATVNGEGVITAVSAGVATITATTENGKVGSIDVVVGNYDVILVDASLPESGKVTEGEEEYSVGVNAFKSLVDALKAVNDDGKIIVKAGTYADDLTIDKNVTIVGPNANVNPNTSKRNDEAIITGVITINEVSALEINGLAFTGSSQIISGTGDIDNAVFANLNVYDKGEATSEWTDTAKDYNKTAFISLMSSSHNVKVLNNKFDLKETAFKNYRAYDTVIEGNEFTNFERDAIRLEGGYNGNVTIIDNSFINDELQGANGIYFSSYGAENESVTINIINNKFKNIGLLEGATYTGAISSKSYQEAGALWYIEDNVFENCVNYLRLRNNATAANHSAYPWELTVRGNAFIGEPAKLYYDCRVTSGDNESTAPAKAVFDDNLFVDASGNVITPNPEKLKNIASNTPSTLSSLHEFECQKLGIEGSIDVVVDAALATADASTKLNVLGKEFTLGTTAFATISEALEKAEAGKAIYVKEGTYSEALAISKAVTLVTNENVTLDKAITLGANDISLIGFTLTQEAWVSATVAVSNIKIKNCVFDGAKVGDPSKGTLFFGAESSNIEIEGTTFKSNDARVVRFDKTVENFTISGCEFENGSGVYDCIRANADAKGEIQIINNKFYNCAQCMIYIANVNGKTTYTIEGNYISNAACASIDTRLPLAIEGTDITFNINYNTFDGGENSWNVIRFRAKDLTAETYKVNFNYNKIINIDLDSVSIIQNQSQVEFDFVIADYNYSDKGEPKESWFQESTKSLQNWFATEEEYEKAVQP